MSKKEIEAIIIGFMCFILTIGICIQVNTVNNNGSTVIGSQQENNLKSQVLKMKEKYENQYNELQKIEKELEKTREKIASSDTELAELESKIKRDNMLIGNTNVSGSGIVVTLSDGKIESGLLLDTDNLIIHAENVLAVVNEMKNAGAEAISINGERIVSTSAISCDGNVIVINGKKVSSPIQITAIGLTELLSTLNRPGGTLSNFKELGKGTDLKKNSNLKIEKYTGVLNFKYARAIY